MKKIIPLIVLLLGIGYCTFLWAEDFSKTEVEKALDSYEGKDPAATPAATEDMAAPTGSEAATAPANEEKEPSAPVENITAAEAPPVVTSEPVSVGVPVNSISEPVNAVEPVTSVPTSPVAAALAEDDALSDRMIDVLELKNIDIIDVLKLLSEKSGLNIIAGNDVQGKITIYLKNVKFKDALRIILDSNNLAYQLEDKIIRIMSAKEYELRYGHGFGGKIQTRIIPLKYAHAEDIIPIFEQMKSQTGKIISDPKSNTLILMDSPDQLAGMEKLLLTIDIPVEVRVYELSYAKSKDISEKILELLTPKVGQLKSDDRSNKIIIRDTPQKIKDISQVVAAFDMPQRQVLIEAKIVQVVLSDQFKYGVNWEAIVRDYHSLDLTSKFNILGDNDKKGRLTIGTIDSDEYTAMLEALQTVGNTNILSSPSVTTMNNQEAKILIGSTEPYVTSTTTTPASGPTTTAESINFIDVGVKLYVTPTIHQDDFITMKIKPEVSSKVDTLLTGDNNKIPIVETSEVETTVRVKDGITIVIGGLIKDEKIRTDNKIPLLGDIPFVGHVFRNKDDLKKKTEIVIFLTPKIISGDVMQNDKLAEPSLPE